MDGIAVQRGFGLTALLVVIGVLTAVSVAVARRMNAADTSERVERVREELLQQAGLIRSKLLACAINWPAGDNGTGNRAQYPGAPGAAAVSGLVCPGAPAALQPLWNGADGVLAPRPMPDFGTWTYVNDAASMRISITAGNTYPYTGAAMRSAALRLGPQASVGGQVLTIVLSN